MLQEYIQQFLQSKRLKAKNTQEFYEKGLRFYSAAYPGWPITDVSIINFLADTSARGCKPATVHCYWRAIKTFCNWLYKRKLITINPVELVDAPKLPHLLPRAPKLQAITDLFASISGSDWYDLRDKALLALSLDTGGRISEIANLKAAELDLEGRTILIRQAKSGRQRLVMFDATTQYYLRLWLIKKKVLGVRLPAVFVGGRNQSKIEPLTPSGIRQILERRLKAAGLDHFRFHDLRHGYAIYSLQNGANLMDVSKQLGHSNIAVTNVYTQVIDDGRGGRHDIYSPVANLPKK